MALPNDNCKNCGIPIPDGEMYCLGCIKQFELDEEDE